MKKKFLYFTIKLTTTIISFILFLLIMLISHIPQNISIIIAIVFAVISSMSGLLFAYTAINIRFDDELMKELEANND